MLMLFAYPVTITIGAAIGIVVKVVENQTGTNSTPTAPACGRSTCNPAPIHGSLLKASNSELVTIYLHLHSL